MDLSDPLPAHRVLFAASECAPLAKTGGLGDVCAALPPALRALGLDVRVLLPGYREVLAAASCRLVAHIEILRLQARLLEARLPGEVPAVILDCPALYDRAGGPYQDAQGRDWPDNALRFGALAKAAALLSSARSPLQWRPDVLHCHDWQAALAPAFLAEERERTPSVLTIHNLAFQGNFAPEILPALGLPASRYSIDGLEFYGKASFLKGGLLLADALTTVSPTYAAEIQTPEFGCGLDGVLRLRSGVLSGILNGIDTTAWNPAKDRFVEKRYSARDLSSKKVNKAALQKRMGLEETEEMPLFGTVGRMTHQKGTDLILEAIDELAALGQVALVGTGERALEEAARAAARRYPGRVAASIGFSEPLAHLLEAGADIFLMPSRFEPCGLNQMYSQRYGTPPVVRATGGLADTVEDGRTGFLFEGDLAGAARRAAQAWRRPKAWRALQRAGMARDFSWSAAARRYAALYSRLAARQPA